MDHILNSTLNRGNIHFILGAFIKWLALVKLAKTALNIYILSLRVKNKYIVED